MKRYSIGLDFGTLSGRCVLVDVENGAEVANSVSEYKHAVMDHSLPDGTTLGVDWALQHPQDYLDVLKVTIRDVMKKSKITPEQIIGVGVVFTGCTILPINRDGMPLCFSDEYKNNPHAYVKLWRHHAAQPQADEINRIASSRNESFLNRYGGKISSEWLFPKVLQIFQEDRSLYEKTDCFLEATDWIVLMLTGNKIRNTCALGFKAIWSQREGFPSKDFFTAIAPEFRNVVEEKLQGTIQSIGTKAGEITPFASELTGLNIGTSVAVGHFDAAGALVGAGITTPGVMLAVMGTSTCHMLLGEDEQFVPGICGRVENGMIPGYIGYEAGQSSVGDLFQWFVDTCVPESYKNDAQNKGISVHSYLSKLAESQLPGEAGIIALDWLNGNRSVLVNGKLSGMLVGLTVQTRPEDIYRALIEATAFGTRKIIETFQENNVRVNYLVASGGISQKNPFIMQLYSDVTNKDIRISGSSQNCALSAAIWGALAAGKEHFGYDDLSEAVIIMSNQDEVIYHPNREYVDIYNQLYKEYESLHDYFGTGKNEVMKRLKDLTEKQRIKKKSQIL
jgi:L-ribulokinase